MQYWKINILGFYCWSQPIFSVNTNFILRLFCFCCCLCFNFGSYYSCCSYLQMTPPLSPGVCLNLYRGLCPRVPLLQLTQDDGTRKCCKPKGRPRLLDFVSSSWVHLLDSHNRRFCIMLRCHSYNIANLHTTCGYFYNNKAY